VHIVIMGCGRVGSTLAHILEDRRYTVAVIDQDPEAFRRLRPSFKGDRVTGVGFDRDVLARAGIERADGFAAVSSGDNSNIIAARVARDQMSIFAGVEEEIETPLIEPGAPEARPTINELLYRPVEGLPISVRAFNGLQNADIKYIGELVQRTEQDMLKIKNFGRKSLNEIKEVLTDMGLSLGMRLENLPSRGELDRMWEEQERRESA